MEVWTGCGGGTHRLALERVFDYAGAMGWHTGPPSWTEMERVLNGKPRRAGWPIDEQVGDGGDSPAWSRKRGAYQPPEPNAGGAADLDQSVPYAELHTHSAYS